MLQKLLMYFLQTFFKSVNTFTPNITWKLNSKILSIILNNIHVVGIKQFQYEPNDNKIH